MIKSWLLWLGLLFVWLIFGAWISNKYFCSSDFVENSPNTAMVPIVKSSCDSSLDLKDSNQFAFASQHNFKFIRSTFKFLPIKQHLGSGIKKISNYLKSHSDRMITIEGRYRSDEKNASIFPNLGFARANAIKKILVAEGTPSSQINLTANLKGNLCFIKDTVTNGVHLNFKALVNDNDRLSKIKSRLYGKPITLYFDTNSDNLSLTEQQRQDFADLNYYLDHVSESSLDIGGHTDSRGVKAYNETLSLGRANFVREYITQNAGISEARMTTKGYGRSNPIESNSTEEGRSKNRRVEVVLR